MRRFGGWDAMPRYLVLFLAALSLVGCAAHNEAYEFRIATERLADNLMGSFRTQQLLLSPVRQVGAAIDKNNGQQPRNPDQFVIDPFIDGDTGNVTGASQEIAAIFTRKIEASAQGRRVLPLSSQTVRQAQYVVTGTLRYEPYVNTDTKKYRIYATVVNIDSGSAMANAAVWVADNKLDDTPALFYKNSPMYLKDQSTKKQIDVAQAQGGSDEVRDYVQSLDAATITTEASEALSRSDYRSAIVLFNDSLKRPDGRTMKNYSGLYQAYYRTNQRDNASRAFRDLFTLAAENSNITVKFLFRVNTTEFITNGDAAAQYDIWLHEAANYLARSGECMTVVGHTSHTGTTEFNMKLSLDRAQRIQKLLAGYAPGAKLTALGRGFEENIRGTGTDDEQDAIDRRVEFRMGGCRTG